MIYRGKMEIEKKRTANKRRILQKPWGQQEIENSLQCYKSVHFNINTFKQINRLDQWLKAERRWKGRASLYNLALFIVGLQKLYRKPEKRLKQWNQSKRREQKT